MVHNGCSSLNADISCVVYTAKNPCTWSEDISSGTLFCFTLPVVYVYMKLQISDASKL